MTKCMSFVDGVQIWHEPYMYSYHNEKFRDPLVIEKMAKFGMDFQRMEEMLKAMCENVPVGKRMKNELFR
ncbi:hypothetical protein HOLleu_08913 [Holothuria leucospilota]|uniref:Uncharacterized protein n=1 Tax=Holothuria leucospilota TaxID=206669 RepID=A0A9Q1CJP6_HOLLE|nr:hypothetical protein HOLleu_08913 [Holothuria leucospilota]